MKLPDLINYRSDFETDGIQRPLKTVPSPPSGLLGLLPMPNCNLQGWPWTEQTDPSVFEAKKNWPKLTIVSPSYNQAIFLEQCIRSVLLQNYPNLEYIIIDGGSTDQSREIIDKYAPWISYQQSKKDRGQSHAINLGFSLSSGDYHAWLNSDDYYLKNVFHKVVSIFQKKNAAFVYGYGLAYHVKENLFKEHKLLPLLDMFIKIPSLIQPSTFWSSAIHQPIWEELHCAMDYELWLRLAKGKRRAMIRECLSVASVHQDAKTSDPKMKIKWEEDHQKIWAANAHGAVNEWKSIVFLNKIRTKLYRFFAPDWLR